MNVVQTESGISNALERGIACCECCGELRGEVPAPPPARASAHVRFIACRQQSRLVDFVVCLTMSSLHSCRWDWCRFTTVLHDDFVQHVISTHIDKAEPVKRADISFIRKVEQGASGHSDSLMGDISNVTVEATVARPEAPQLSFTSGSTFVLPLSPQMPHATSSDGSLAGSQGTSQFNLQTQAPYKS
ncbi:hypothetical protein BGY98DRAFT_731251 [Russula aff. rugulosa BPL654]|nr:hypothetical protein BGY98DRAFT_731251 [Russula aff. rugulosa BPL654]